MQISNWNSLRRIIVAKMFRLTGCVNKLTSFYVNEIIVKRGLSLSAWVVLFMFGSREVFDNGSFTYRHLQEGVGL